MAGAHGCKISQPPAENPPATKQGGSDKTLRNMQLSSLLLCGALVSTLQLSSTFTVGTRLTGSDVDLLKVLLHRMEASLPEQSAMDQDGLENPSFGTTPEDQQTNALDDEKIREFFSAKNLKSVRNDSTKKSSSCFGRRMDSIGSRSSLGCNTVGRYNPK